jgi:hypothetical protein
MRTVTDQIRGGLMWLSVVLFFVTAIFTAIIPSGRIDSPEEFVMAVRSARTWAGPIAFAVFMVILFLPRPAILKRFAFSLLIGIVIWVVVWKWLVHCDYTQLRLKGVDPNQVLQSAKP